MIQRGIQKRQDVCGGSACIGAFRIPVWAFVNLRRLGADDARILEAYPDLSDSDLTAAWDYAAANEEEIEQEIRENERVCELTDPQLRETDAITYIRGWAPRVAWKDWIAAVDCSSASRSAAQSRRFEIKAFKPGSFCKRSGE